MALATSDDENTEDSPSGPWRIRARISGGDGNYLYGTRTYTDPDLVAKLRDMGTVDLGVEADDYPLEYFPAELPMLVEELRRLAREKKLSGSAQLVDPKHRTTSFHLGYAYGHVGDLYQIEVGERREAEQRKKQDIAERLRAARQREEGIEAFDLMAQGAGRADIEDLFGESRASSLADEFQTSKRILLEAWRRGEVPVFDSNLFSDRAIEALRAEFQNENQREDRRAKREGGRVPTAAAGDIEREKFIQDTAKALKDMGRPDLAAGYLEREHGSKEGETARLVTKMRKMAAITASGMNMLEWKQLEAEKEAERAERELERTAYAKLDAHCDQCGARLDLSARPQACPNCGTRFMEIVEDGDGSEPEGDFCPECGSELKGDPSSCGSCGAQFQGSPEDNGGRA